MAHPHRDHASSQSHGIIRSGNTGTNLRVMATNNIDEAHATDSDDHGDVSDASDTNVGIRRRLNSNQTVPDPTQIRFYSGSWVDVLKDAKYQFRFCVHTEEPFPERTRETLTVAHDCLLEAIAKFQNEVKLPLDEGLLQRFIIGIN
jgi:hypothetical protein